ncbi:MAG: AAA family ATPase [Phormidesmis sp. RL_2_1]|nr:AAA family ATPase [Phormidesmis sp. RL_2_1]
MSQLAPTSKKLGKHEAQSSPLIPEILPGIALSQQQWEALQALEDFIHSDEKIYLLTGYAGTGKTTLMKELTRQR